MALAAIPPCETPSRSSFVPSVLDGLQRFAAAYHLASYKDDDVIAALKKCLTDDYVCELRVNPDDATKHKRYYAVRKAAYEVLRAWKIDVDRPALEPPPPEVAPAPRSAKSPE